MFCAACAEPTGRDPCEVCGAPALLDGRYRLERLVGEGAHATTWAGTNVGSGRIVAIKEIPVRGLQGDKALELVRREARVLRELHHSSIPAWVEDFSLGRGKNRALYLVEELMEGESLAAELAHRRYTVDEVLDVVEEVLGILVYLHGLSPPVLHRDIKPANLIRRADGTLALVDFDTVRDALRTRLGGSTIAGTFGYMAPEQFHGDAWPSTDLFAVGVLAVALLTREDPGTLMDWSGRLHWTEHLDIHPSVRAYLSRLLQPDPDKRLHSAAVALTAIRTLRADLDAIGYSPTRAMVARVSPEEVATRTRRSERLEMLARIRWAAARRKTLRGLLVDLREEWAVLSLVGGSALALGTLMTLAILIGYV